MKGAIFAEYLRWYATVYDGARLARAIRDNPICREGGLTAEPPVFGIVPSIWYPARVCHAVLDAATLGMNDIEKTRFVVDGTQFVADKLMSGLYATLVRWMGTPERFSAHIQSGWNQLHTSGEREIRIVKPGEALSLVRAWPGHHPLLCRMIHETARSVFARMGIGTVTSSFENCVSLGHHECVARLQWTKHR